MINTIRSEWLKLRTVRINYVLAAIAFAAPVIIATLDASLRNVDDWTSESLISTTTGWVTLTGLLLGVMSACSATGEFGFGTIRPTLTATPSRIKVVAAKSIVVGVAAAVVQMFVIACSLVLILAVVNGRGGSISLSEAGDMRIALVGSVSFAVIIALLGAGVGILLRHTGAAVAALILWPTVIEPLFAGFLGSVLNVDNPFKWMPFLSGFNLGSSELDSSGLSRSVGGLYFFSLAVLVTAIGTVLLERRDA